MKKSIPGLTFNENLGLGWNTKNLATGAELIMSTYSWVSSIEYRPFWRSDRVSSMSMSKYSWVWVPTEYVLDTLLMFSSILTSILGCPYVTYLVRSYVRIRAMENDSSLKFRSYCSLLTSSINAGLVFSFKETMCVKMWLRVDQTLQECLILPAGAILRPQIRKTKGLLASFWEERSEAAVSAFAMVFVLEVVVWQPWNCFRNDDTGDSDNDSEYDFHHCRTRQIYILFCFSYGKTIVCSIIHSQYVLAPVNHRKSREDRKNKYDVGLENIILRGNTKKIITTTVIASHS